MIEIQTMVQNILQNKLAAEDFQYEQVKLKCTFLIPFFTIIGKTKIVNK